MPDREFSDAEVKKILGHLGNKLSSKINIGQEIQPPEEAVRRYLSLANKDYSFLPCEFVGLWLPRLGTTS